MIEISPEEFKVLSKYIHDISGILLDTPKKYLLETRLSTVAQANDCDNYLELYQKASRDPRKIIEKQIVDAISTNETLFFRDNGPFELLQHKIIPELIDARKPSSPLAKTPIKIWSAAASTGQELYSIAIVLKELLGNTSKYRIKLFGTDISDSAIKQASMGKYNKFEIERGLARNKLNKYFTLSGNSWKVKDEIRAMASFRKINLMLPFQGLGKFDIVFCRNVAIYFSVEDRKKMFNKIADIMEPDGYLIIGATESLTGACPRFRPKKHLKTIFYQLK
jgi:chemotaxis protein methyltransferase CheR